MTEQRVTDDVLEFLLGFDNIDREIIEDLVADLKDARAEIARLKDEITERRDSGSIAWSEYDKWR